MAATSPAASRSGLPISRLISSASTSARASKTALAPARISARFLAPSAAHAGCAARTRATASRTSGSGVISTSPIASPVLGS